MSFTHGLCTEAGSELFDRVLIKLWVSSSEPTTANYLQIVVLRTLLASNGGLADECLRDWSAGDVSAP